MKYLSHAKCGGDHGWEQGVVSLSSGSVSWCIVENDDDDGQQFRVVAKERMRRRKKFECLKIETVTRFNLLCRCFVVAICVI